MQIKTLMNNKNRDTGETSKNPVLDAIVLDILLGLGEQEKRQKLIPFAIILYKGDFNSREYVARRLRESKFVNHHNLPVICDSSATEGYKVDLDYFLHQRISSPIVP